MRPIQKVEDAIQAEVQRQDARWGAFTNDRPSIRLGLACLEDEARESRDAYRDDCHDDFCGLGFMHTQEELVQTAAIAIRLLLALP